MTSEQKKQPVVISAAWVRGLASQLTETDLSTFLETLGPDTQTWIPLAKWNSALQALSEKNRPTHFWQDLGAMLEAQASLWLPTWIIPPHKLSCFLLKQGLPRLIKPSSVQISANEPRQLTLDLRLPNHESFAPPFQFLIAGILESFTLHLAKQSSRVTSTQPTPWHLRFQIHLPESQTALAKFARHTKSLLSRKSALETLIQQQAEVSGKSRDLFQLQNDFEEILNSNPLGILVLHQDTVAYANPALLEMGSTTTPESLQEILLTKASDLPRQLQKSNCIWTFNCPSHPEVIASVTEGSRINFHGKPARVFIFRDITSERLLEQDLLKSSEKERERISFDIHDGMGQLLTGTAFRAHALHLSLKDESGSEASEAREICQLLNRAIDQAQGLARGLNPVSEFEGGFTAALQNLIQPYHNKVSLDIPPGELNFESAIENQLYRIIQEALTNAIRHGQADQIVIKISPNLRNITISDNGIGFDPKATREEQSLGLRSMKYRAHAINMPLAITSSPRGTIVAINLHPPSKTTLPTS